MKEGDQGKKIVVLVRILTAILIVGVGISAVLHDEIGRGGERYRM